MDKIIFPKLSYELTGLCFKIHNALGRFARERQYTDQFEELLKQANINYYREKEIVVSLIGNQGNIPDFIIENKIIVDLKAKKFILKEDYYQMKRYLIAANFKIGLIVNFRNKYLKPIRVLNSEFYSQHSPSFAD